MDSENSLQYELDSGPRRRQSDTTDGGTTVFGIGGDSVEDSGLWTRPELLGEQVRILYGNARRSIWANVVALVAFVAVAFAKVPPATLWGWVAATLILLCVRYLMVSFRTRRPGFPEPAARLALEYTATATLTGIAFATGFLLFAPELADHERSLMVVAIAGMCAGAAVSMGSYRLAFFGYSMTLLLPAMLYACVLFWRERTLLLAAETYIVGAYSVVMMIVHAGTASFIRESLTLQSERARQLHRLENRNVSLSRDRDAFHRASLTDGLTGIPNRRSFDETLEAQWKLGLQQGNRLGCLLVDIDHFKSFNDTYGHDAGDRCLVQVAQAMHEVVQRQGDFLARYGGEEFAVLLSDTASAGALYMGELIRDAVESAAIEHKGSPHSVVTASVGASSLTPTPKRHSAELIRRADEALYSAKARGRNRIQLLRIDGEITADSGPHPPSR